MIHTNSLQAYKDLDLETRRGIVFEVYKGKPPLTDRQVKRILQLEDMNEVRPRVTELIQQGKLIEVKTVRCEKTGRPVRACTVNNRLERQICLWN